MFVRFLAGVRVPAGVLRVTVDAETEDLAFAASDDMDYYLAGDNTSGDLLPRLKACLETHSEITVAFVSINADGKVECSALLGPDITLRWSHANTTLDGAVFGFDVETDTATAPTVTAPNMPEGSWLPGRGLADDTLSQPSPIGAITTSISGVPRASRIARAKRTRDAMVPLVPQDRLLVEFAPSTHKRACFEYLWDELLLSGRTLRLYPDATDNTIYTVWFLRDMERPWERSGQGNGILWEVSLRLREGPAFEAPPVPPSVQSVLFDGTNFLTTPDDSIFDPSATFTIGFWFKGVPSRNLGFASKGGATNNFAYRMHIRDTVSAVTISFSRSGNGVGLVGAAVNFTTAGSAVPNTIWTHVAIRYNGSTGDVDAFVNGVEVQSLSFTAPFLIFNSSGVFRIGANADGAQPQTAGNLMTHVFTARTFLSSSDITAAYNARQASEMPSDVESYMAFGDFDGTTSISEIGGYVFTASGVGLAASTDVPV